LNTIDSMSSTPRGKAKTVYTFAHSAAQKGGCIQTCHWRVLCFNVRVDNAVFLIVHVSDNHACSASKVGIKFGDQKVCRGCKVARYCSDRCQENDWNSHKKALAMVTGHRNKLKQHDHLGKWAK
jgi:hypothetical protein